jgi:hypothetical protein
MKDGDIVEYDDIRSLRDQFQYDVWYQELYGYEEEEDPEEEDYEWFGEHPLEIEKLYETSTPKDDVPDQYEEIPF